MSDTIVDDLENRLPFRDWQKLIPFGALTVTVEGGAHRDAHQRVDGGPVTIGSGLDNTIVLFGDALPDCNAQITMTDELFGKGEITAIDGPVLLPDGSLLDTGDARAVKLPCTIRCGDIPVTIAPAMDLDGFWTKLISGLLLVAAFVIGMHLVSSLPRVLPSTSSAGAEIVGDIRSSVDRLMTGEARRGGLMRRAEADPLSALSTRLGDAQLNGPVQLQQTSTGAIIATGLLDDAEMQRWRGVLQWHDLQTSAPLLVNNVKLGDGEADLPEIQSVWMGDDPHVVLKGGEMAREGERLAGGWTLERITGEGIILNQDGRRISVTF
ncbi:MAG: hypothetical protein AAF638_08015 [Pseudomonadota bacterium]